MCSDDFVGIIVDTYNTMQSGYTFLVNPLGIQGDGMMTTDGNLTDEQDFIWYSKGASTTRATSVEYRIPLQSIRFPAGETITMRLVVLPPVRPDLGNGQRPARSIPTRAASWPRPSRSPSRASSFKRVVELLPAVTYSDRKAADQGGLQTGRAADRLRPDRQGRLDATT